MSRVIPLSNFIRFKKAYTNFVIFECKDLCASLYREINGCDYTTRRQDKKMKVNMRMIKWVVEEWENGNYLPFARLIRIVYCNHYKNDIVYMNNKESSLGRSAVDALVGKISKEQQYQKIREKRAKKSLYM